MKDTKIKGYSIVEIMVYIAIFAFLSMVVINSFINVMSAFNNTRTYRDLSESGSIVMERISREIRQAKTINITNSVFNSTNGVLELNSTSSAGTSKVIKFMISGNALNIYQDGTLVGNLLKQNISPSSLLFRRITNTNSDAVKIEMTLIDTRNNTNPTSVNFYNTITLRGSY